MPNLSRSRLASLHEYGVDMAAKLSDVPEHILRIDVDKGRVSGVRKTAGGHRRISREGLLAYLKANGYDTKRLESLDRREAERVWTNQPRRVALAFSDPRFAGVLGEGRGTLVDLSLTGFQLKDLAWKGCLPGPKGILRFQVLGGELRGMEGTVGLAWIHYRGEDFRMGLGLERVSDPAVWKVHVQGALETRIRMAEALYLGASN